MKVDTTGHTTVIKDVEEDLVAFLMKLTHEFKTFEKHNLIIDLSHHKKLTPKEVNTFLSLSKKHRSAKKSFVIVVENFDFNKASDKLSIVPTLLEAHDIIAMDEIERDLGF